MKNKLLIFASLLLFSLGVEAQETPANRTRSGDAFTQVDNYLVALKRLGIPSGDAPTLNAFTSAENSAKLFFNTTDTTLYVYREDLQEWLKVATDGIKGDKGDKGDEGVGLEYEWDNTQLGIKREDEANYTFVDLKGDKGDQGEQGIQGIQGEKGDKGDKGDEGPLVGLSTILQEGNSANNLKITNLADGTDPLDAVNKQQLDGVESPFEVIDVTQQAYSDIAINVKDFGNTQAGMTYQEGAIDFGVSRDSIHEMGLYSFKSGLNTTASGPGSSAFGAYTSASGSSSSAFGISTVASGESSSAFGDNTEASGSSSSAFGYSAIALGESSSAFGNNTVASGESSSAFGAYTIASGEYSSAFGISTEASGSSSSAFGISTVASGSSSSAFGISTVASGESSSAFGDNTEASGSSSSAFGISTVASGSSSSAFGISTVASGHYSSAFGERNISNEYASLVIGRYSTDGTAETSWTDGSPIFKVGNGTSVSNRKNAYVLYNDGRSEQEKDMEVTTIGQGFVLKSPDGTRWRITVDNSGNLDTEQL